MFVSGVGRGIDIVKNNRSENLQGLFDVFHLILLSVLQEAVSSVMQLHTINAAAVYGRY